MTMDILSAIANNRELCDALKTAFTEEFENETLDETIPNEQLGAVVRARLEGLRKVERVFRRIESMRTPPVQTIEPNPAR